MLWNFGVLSFCDIVRNSSSLSNDILRNLETGLRFQKIRSIANDDFTTLCGLIARDPEERLPIDGSSLTLPMLLHHCNTKMIAMSVRQAIENLLNMHLGGLGEVEVLPPHLSNEVTARLKADGSLKALLWCLFSLQATGSGRVHAQKALDVLCAKWGDLILGCWVIDKRDQADRVL